MTTQPPPRLYVYVALPRDEDARGHVTRFREATAALSNFSSLKTLRIDIWAGRLENRRILASVFRKLVGYGWYDRLKCLMIHLKTSTFPIDDLGAGDLEFLQGNVWGSTIRLPRDLEEVRVADEVAKTCRFKRKEGLTSESFWGEAYGLFRHFRQRGGEVADRGDSG
ncbi:hypothetical protein TWF481_002176 [Arthrobotrys musiformis]|uniref:Uncharacterized protein n=1 Tax=Arthrobotrys musiformis TaxID=47236 RepID=A0AAV9VUC5_9PEZI